MSRLVTWMRSVAPSPPPVPSAVRGVQRWRDGALALGRPEGRAEAAAALQARVEAAMGERLGTVRPAVYLGFGGVVPFVAGTLGYVTLPVPYCDKALLFQEYYAATILSFLGAVHWGVALKSPMTLQRAWTAYGYSVTPALVAWTGLMMPGQSAGLATLLTGFGGALTYDLYSLRGVVPGWYLRLRIALSIVAMSSLGLSLHGTRVFRREANARTEEQCEE